MKAYIDKSTLVAEIERRIKERDFQMKSGCWISSTYMYEDLLDFIDTLEVKEINNVWNNASDFSKAEAGRSMLLIEDNGHAELLKSPSAERLFYFRTTNLKMWAYVDELLSITAHFEVKKVDYGIEVHKYAQEHFNVYDDVNKTLQTKENKTLLGRKDFEDIAKHFFELGSKAQSKDMIEALRTEYEKGRADVIADTLSWLENCWPKYCSNHTIIEGFKEAIKGE